MIEDKLTHDERLRLECVAQAVIRTSPILPTSEVLRMAAEFEKFVRGEEQE